MRIFDDIINIKIFCPNNFFFCYQIIYNIYWYFFFIINQYCTTNVILQKCVFKAVRKQMKYKYEKMCVQYCAPNVVL